MSSSSGSTSSATAVRIVSGTLVTPRLCAAEERTGSDPQRSREGRSPELVDLYERERFPTSTNMIATS
jgi:hypothetical protein